MTPQRDGEPGLDIYEFLWTVTRFGGAHVVIPACCGLFLGLWRMDEKVSARAFLLSAAFCFFWIVIAKITLLTARGFSPSGHTAISTFFYLSVGYLAVSLRPSVLTAAFAAALGVLVALIGISRFTVAGHTPMEALAGLICGLAAFEIFRRRARFEADAGSFLRAAPVALIAAVLINRLMSFGFLEEQDLRDFAQWLRGEILGWA